MALLERPRVGGDGRILGLAPARLHGTLRVQDGLLDAVPLELLAVAEAPPTRALALGRAGRALRRGGLARGARRLPLRVVGEGFRPALAIEARITVETRSSM